MWILLSRVDRESTNSDLSQHNQGEEEENVGKVAGKARGPGMFMFGYCGVSGDDLQEQLKLFKFSYLYNQQYLTAFAIHTFRRYAAGGQHDFRGGVGNIELGTEERRREDM